MRSLLYTGVGVIASVAVWVSLQEVKVAPSTAFLSKAPGSRVRLSHGHTHYEVMGPEDGKRVVFVHGFTLPSFHVWRETAEHLAEKGFRVLIYDLYGRGAPPAGSAECLLGAGFSDAPDAIYDRSLFTCQLRELLTVVPGFNQPVTLVGASMGGAIVAAFSQVFPDQVAKLVLVAPAGVTPAPVPLLGKIAQLRGIGEFLVEAQPGLMRDNLGAHISKGYANPNAPRSKVAIERAGNLLGEYVAHCPGFLRAVLSTLRHGPISDLSDAYRSLAASSRPTLVFWGDSDVVVPTSDMEVLKQTLPKATFELLSNSGHDLMLESAPEFHKSLVEFLRS